MVKRKQGVRVGFRLDQSKHLQLRMALAGEGLSLQEALERSVDELIARSQHQGDISHRPTDLSGILASARVMELSEQERRVELDRDCMRL